MADDEAWIVQRTYSNQADGRQQTILVAVGTPRKLLPQERPFDSDVNEFGCPVQTGERHTRRLVCGRDAMEALFHALLSVDAFLAAVSSKSALADEAGRAFNPSSDGLLQGAIGKQYIEHFAKR